MELVALFFGVVGATLLLFGLWKRDQLMRQYPDLWWYLHDPESAKRAHGQISSKVFDSLSKADLVIVAGVLFLVPAILFAVFWVLGEASQAM